MDHILLHIEHAPQPNTEPIPPTTHSETTQANSLPNSDNQHFIFFKSDRIYAHRLICFNYMTYNIPRAQDVVNPGTSHCNIMLLRRLTSDSIEEASTHQHPFLYGSVIGIYHANIVYTGPRMLNYNPTQFNFLWVRWYQNMPIEGPLNQRSPYRFDRLSFPPMASEGAFGFVDPADVLRSCHIIPAFNQGDCGVEGMSTFAQDSEDWEAYYIGW